MERNPEVGTTERPESADDLAARVAATLLSREGTGAAWGLVIEEARAGYARVRMAVSEQMLNGHRTVHGGMVFALADSAFAYACNGRDQSTVAQQASIVFLSPARAGETLIAEAREIALAGRSGGDQGRRRTARSNFSGAVANRGRLSSVRRSMMSEAFICDAVRTSIGRYGGNLAEVRPDDLGAVPMRALKERNPRVDWEALDDIYYGCANQAGEDNRNVARMSALLAGLGESAPGTTVNRLCGSGLDAVTMAARAIRADEAELMIAGGVESMTRAPFVIPKAESAFSRANAVHDTAIGWRFVNKALKHQFGIDSMPETTQNVADDFQITRADQDKFAVESQRRAAAAQASGRFAVEIVAVHVPQKKGDHLTVDRDEHPRETSVDALAKLKPIVRPDGSVTAGNASGVNDGAAALIIASEAAITRHGLTPRARIMGGAVAGVAPRIMGMGPAPATEKLLARLGMRIAEVDLVELNEAFASQGLAVLRRLGLPDDAEHVNPNGGAIALGHPLGMSGARLALTATEELGRRDARYALCTMCIGVGQGIALMIEQV